MSRSPDSPLLTDLYQLTMLQGYFEEHMEDTAVFEFFVRKLPATRNFLVAAGLEQVMEYLQGLRFSREDLDWLRSTRRFGGEFIDWLGSLRFTGDVDAVAEGTIVFPNEPILRITAPLPQAQWVETRIINLLHFETLIASKAARMVLCAPGKTLVDFGLRRAHGAEAGLLAARTAYLAGFSGTATVLAGRCFDIPLYGTMAHSFIQAFDDEELAFEHYALAQPDGVVLLIDTYDTEAAAEKVVRVAARLKTRGIAVKSVRLDSGDLADHARKVRAILDAGGLREVRIFASGNVDESILSRYAATGVPIDGFGVGTHLDTSADAPYLDCAYKLEEYAGRPRRKRSEGKATIPGRKQVYRYYDDAGRLSRDSLSLYTEVQAAEPLVRPVMRGGKPVGRIPTLAEARAHALAELERLPGALRSLDPAPPYPVEVSVALQGLMAAMDR